mmetsp:Transcript_16543/g.24847  ORF Transcript_16543/g.24847 Transcript_16543/m.24847 type:complete len:474 (+) Transcript_16543:230-1651(+)
MRYFLLTILFSCVSVHQCICFKKIAINSPTTKYDSVNEIVIHAETSALSKNEPEMVKTKQFNQESFSIANTQVLKKTLFRKARTTFQALHVAVIDHFHSIGYICSSIKTRHDEGEVALTAFLKEAASPPVIIDHADCRTRSTTIARRLDLKPQFPFCWDSEIWYRQILSDLFRSGVPFLKQSSVNGVQLAISNISEQKFRRIEPQISLTSSGNPSFNLRISDLNTFGFGVRTIFDLSTSIQSKLNFIFKLAQNPWEISFQNQKLEVTLNEPLCSKSISFDLLEHLNDIRSKCVSIGKISIKRRHIESGSFGSISISAVHSSDELSNGAILHTNLCLSTQSKKKIKPYLHLLTRVGIPNNHRSCNNEFSFFPFPTAIFSKRIRFSNENRPNENDTFCRPVSSASIFRFLIEAQTTPKIGLFLEGTTGQFPGELPARIHGIGTTLLVKPFQFDVAICFRPVHSALLLIRFDPLLT